MKTENNLENKAKFFAQYYKQKICLDNKGIANEPWLNYSWGEIDKLYLELTPLSQITDEDAEYCVGKVECSMRKNDINHGDFGMSPSAIFVNSLMGNNSYHIGRREADYLRMKGYSVKWVDLSVEDLVEYGWIKLKES